MLLQNLFFSFLVLFSYLTRTFSNVGSAIKTSSPSLSASVLLVSSLDGRVTALRADNGRIVWSLETGGSLLSVHQSTTPIETTENEDTSFETNKEESTLPNTLPRVSKQPFIIPSRDGSIMTLSSPFNGLDEEEKKSRAISSRSSDELDPFFYKPLPGELRQLPFRAPELVSSHLPFSSGDTLLLGSKSTSLLQVSLSTGRVLRVLSGVANVPSSGFNSNNEKNVWISRSDYIVKSFDSNKIHEHWNVTYAEVSPVYSIPSIPHVNNHHRSDSGFESPSSSFPQKKSHNFTNTLRLSATMQGRIIATSINHKDKSDVTDTTDKSRGWVGPDLGSPISSIFVASITNDESIELISVPFSEIWPRSTSSTKSSSSSLSSSSSSSGVTVPDMPPVVKGARVYVGRLPGGQMYAAREELNSIELIPDTSEDTGIDIEEVEREVEQLLEKSLVDITSCEGDDCAVALVGMYSVPINDMSLSSAVSVGPLVSRDLVDSSTFLSLPSFPLARQWIQAGLAKVIGTDDSSNQPPIKTTGLASSSTTLSLPAPPNSAVTITEVGRKQRQRVKWLLSLSELLVSMTLRLSDSKNDREDAEGFTYDTLFAAGTMTFAALVGANASLFYLSWLRAQKKKKREARSRLNSTINASSSSDDSSEGERITNISLQKSPREIIIDGISHKLVGRLAVSESSIGFGSHGTLVLRGMLDKRPVAVKRMLIAFHPAARREISLLIKTDGHPNVVRYHACEEDGNFVYLALELCERGSLALAVDACARARVTAGCKKVPVLGPATRRFLAGIIAGISHLHLHGIVHRDIKPQNILLAKSDSVIKDLTGSSLYPESEHTDIGISTLPKISDFGLGKQLSAGEHSSSQGLSVSRVPSVHPFSSSSVSSSMIAPGSVGWQAPEIVLLGRRALMLDHGLNQNQNILPQVEEVDEEDKENSKDGFIVTTNATESSKEPMNQSIIASDLSDKQKRSADIWSLGCVLYNVIDAGNHPFGEPFERETNAVQDKRDLSRIGHLHEAKDLIESMLSSDATNRPSIAEVGEHVLFWNDEKRTEFLCSLSDRLENELEKEMTFFGGNMYDGNNNNYNSVGDRSYILTSAFEIEHASIVLGETKTKGASSWYPKMPAVLMTEMMRRRRYDFTLLRDLLRLIRNMRSHLRELSPRVLESLGATDSDVSIVSPWVLSQSRFPQLLLRCYNFACNNLAHEASFAALLGPATTKKWSAKAAMRYSTQLSLLNNTRTGVVDVLTPLSPSLHASAPVFTPFMTMPVIEALTASISNTLPSTTITTTIPAHFISYDSSNHSVIYPPTTASATSFLHTEMSSPYSGSYTSEGDLSSFSGNIGSGASSMPIQSSSSSSSSSTLSLSSSARFSANSPPFEPKTPTSMSRDWWLPEDAWYQASFEMSNRINTLEGGAIIVLRTNIDTVHGVTSSELVPVICAYQRVEETRFQNGAHIFDDRYKCKECNDWTEGRGVCPRGVRCDFAHGPIELKILKALRVGINSSTCGGEEAKELLGSLNTLFEKERKTRHGKEKSSSGR
jgi:serine/threonine protein kinase